MAVRLVKRCTCLLRGAMLEAPALAPGCGLRLSRVAPRVLTSSATSPSSHFPGPLSGLVEKERAFAANSEHQDVDQLIEKATRPEELLELFRGGHCLHENHAALILIQLSRLLANKPEDKKALLLQDAHFQQLLQLVNSQITSVWHGILVKLLRSLYALALPGACKELQSVEQEVRWRLRRLKYRHLVFLAESSATYMQERDSQELLAELLVHLERRWAEIEDCRMVVSMMAKIGHLSEPLMNRLEDKCLELVEQFGPDELRKVLLTLATQNRRSVPLLRAISYHLVQKPFPLTKGILLDLAYAYGKLGFQQTQVFQRLASDLLPRAPSLTSSEVARCTKSFALLKWVNGPLFEAFVQHILDRAQTITGLHLCNMLLAFAHLNFHPEQEDQFFCLVREKLGSMLSGLPPALQVDVVWALCVLQQVQEAELRAVLCPELHTQFLGGGSPKHQSTFQKLLHINATAQLEYPEYTGPLLPASAVVPRLSALDRKVTPLQKELQDTLRGLLGSKGSFMVPTQYGWVLDAEVVLDPDSQFLPPRDFVAPHLAPPSGSQPLPPGAKRLAFLRWEFPNYSSRSRDLLGRFVLARRHVLAAGFLVVDVPYYEWLELKSEWQKGAYLKDKIRKAVAEELAK
ncbi:FAST kinase domain-containing protein 4 [Canis lupus familiaris]|uniref:FAST kinase domain-containing protein 4 n=3 Tax=Canis lupus TaxID=9612 RepID=A0A8C0TIP6_CANLF|nr:FAST kinase domain-containing protein 4 [Canis lupus familiaris]XP_005642256.1 FAST kinase domain-containing protein 4 [Canis lupus familiaris]XP_025289724.1 FAST kinase domain-containing protein 4 isoform X1 [Canis lupus dingo]XP_025289735.1 FAST kinase domain-containing protein 4 isoform X1 [Canis lupus dingo]XP_025289741.1 FAST kinase domain-containing protein 4 isoform X1 [Canis lupus dingo]XP_038415452.1 FAST kinase domain-containing protein 4 [Canis lupus familiaris]XP_038415453.1 FA|eukprot:XP_005642255.1 protein TBRG4 [Canis lupus familiaris]